MHGTLPPIPAELAAVPLTAPDAIKPKRRRKAAPPVSPSNLVEITRSTRSTRSEASEPAEMLGSDRLEPGTRSRVPTRSTRSRPADEPELAGDGADFADDEFRAAADEATFGALCDDPHADEMAEAIGSDPFGPLGDADRQRAAHIPAGSGGKAGDDDDVLTVLPCPGAVPGLDYFRLKDGSAPSRVWVYRTAEGAAVVVAARYDGTAADGTPTKDVRPWTFGRRVWTGRDGRQHDRTGWHCKAPPAPRLLYGLERLAARPDAPVLVTEGEKAADAAGLLFPDSICITSQGGSKAPGKSDWTPLRGRRVMIWPDNDEPGAGYAAKVAELATAAGAELVRTVEVPADWPEGWDLADALPDGVTLQRLAELLDDAPDGAAAELPHGFKMTLKGLMFFPEFTEKNPDPPPIWIAAPFRVLGETRSDTGEAWGLFLSLARPRGQAAPVGDPAAADPSAGQRNCRGAGRCRFVVRSRWASARFAETVRRAGESITVAAMRGPHRLAPGRRRAGVRSAGGEAFGRGAADTILQAEHASADAAYRAAGTLAGWQSGVAALAVGNDRLALFLAAAFAGPLLDVLGEPSGGLHLVGDSRTGKTHGGGGGGERCGESRPLTHRCARGVAPRTAWKAWRPKHPTRC